MVGEWTGTGHTGIGVFDPTTGTWYRRNEVSAGAPDAGQFGYGAPGWQPLAGHFQVPGSTATPASATVIDQALGTPLLENLLPGGTATAVSASSSGHIPGGYCNCPLCQALRSGALALHQVNLNSTPPAAAPAQGNGAAATPPV